MMPFLYAEQDRKYLKTLNKLNRDEQELMKDVRGWTADSFFGEKVYKTLPDNSLPAISLSEYTCGVPKFTWQYNVITPDYWK